MQTRRNFSTLYIASSPVCPQLQQINGVAADTAFTLEHQAYRTVSYFRHFNELPVFQQSSPRKIPSTCETCNSSEKITRNLRVSSAALCIHVKLSRITNRGGSAVRSQRTKESTEERKESAQDIINAAWGDIINTENNSRGIHTTTKLHVNEGCSAEVSRGVCVCVYVCVFSNVLSSPRLTCIVTIRGNGWRVLAPPSMAIPRVLALFATLTSVEVGSNRPGYVTGKKYKLKHKNISLAPSRTLLYS